MKHVCSKTFWSIIDHIDADLETPISLVETDMTEDVTFTSISVNGRVVGEEVACHRSARIRHYLALGEAA